MPFAITREYAAPIVEPGREADDELLMNFYDQWQEVPDTENYDNGFKIQWEHFIRHVVENAPYRWTLPEGAKGVQLVEAALDSWKERRWVDVPSLGM